MYVCNTVIKQIRMKLSCVGGGRAEVGVEGYGVGED